MIAPLALLAALTLAQSSQPAANAQAAPAPAKADAAGLAATVQKLVQQLDSPSSAERTAAEQELIRLGPDVLPHLPTTGPRTPAEVRNRLGRVRAALMKLEIEAATRPAIVTLAGEMPVSQAIAEIVRQTGNPLVDYRERFNQPASDPKIKIRLDKVSFWQALDTVLDAAGLTIFNYDEERGALAYTSRGEGAPPRLGRASYSGLFRLEPRMIEARRELRGMGTRALTLTLDAVWEPRVRPIALEVPLAEVAAQDDQGGIVAVDQSEGTVEAPVEGGSSAVEIRLPFTPPPRSASKLAHVKGRLTALLLGKVETFEFTDLEKISALSQERGGVTVTVESCRKNGDIYDVNLRVRFDRAANALESHRGWIYENECYLLDAQGGKKGNDGLEATLLSASEVGLSYKFDLGEKGTPAGYRFVYRTPADILKIPVAFELQDIELP